MSTTAASRVGKPDLPGARRLRVHVENARALQKVFIVRPDQYEAAVERHPDVAQYLDTTIGYDFEVYNEAMATAEVLIGYKFPTKELSVRAPRLRWIQVLGAGVDYMGSLHWLPAGMIVTTNSGAHVPKAVQSACMAILAVNARLPALMTSQRRSQWNRIFTTVVTGKTLLIIGVGHIGGGVARMAKEQLGMRVLGIRRSAQAHQYVDEMYGVDRLHEMLPRADVILMTTALTSSTRGLMGRKEFGLMKREASFINMSRGGLVDYEALAERLTRDELAGALVDVAPMEPLPPDSPLWNTPNLIMTPHVLSDDIDEYVPRTLDGFMANIRRYFAGEPLVNRVDPAREY